MSKVWQQRLAEEFNRSFNEPFMPKGFCEARAVEFDWNGSPIGSGSNVGSAISWEVKRRTERLPDVIDEN